MSFSSAHHRISRKKAAKESKISQGKPCKYKTINPLDWGDLSVPTMKNFAEELVTETVRASAGKSVNHIF